LTPTCPLPTSDQLVESTVPPLSWNDLFIARLQKSKIRFVRKLLRTNIGISCNNG
jgi:hypothetical protein